ncbi:hypothetical protein OSB04_003009 [Centaurea solstitialis]|uniref:Integrase catalytic domain-containing protein n=1 Tax=Centaurea solstitialis TaxID=347529 RepID=A0AA38TU04_9ASTR|nr:hypothetical protein OSB04_003009 [Centaurea solstitialis]
MAMTNPFWQEAIAMEFAALKKLVLLPRKRVISCKWIQGMKARSIAYGFTQLENEDYFETFSSIVKFATIRCIVAIVVKKRWPIHQLDINKVFLHEEVCMKRPPGMCCTNLAYVCKLTKSLIWFQANIIAMVLSDLVVDVVTPIALKSNNLANIHIANNPVFHEMPKHIELGCYYVKELGFTLGGLALPNQKPIHSSNNDGLIPVLAKDWDYVGGPTNLNSPRYIPIWNGEYWSFSNVILMKAKTDMRSQNMMVYKKGGNSVINYKIFCEFHVTKTELLFETQHFPFVDINHLLIEWVSFHYMITWMSRVLKKDASARHVWQNLETLFRVNKDSKALQIDSELRNINMGDLSVTAYCTKIKSLADLLANLDPESAIPDKHLVIYTINGLSQKFESVASIIRYRSPLPSFLETRSMLLMEEQRLNMTRPHLHSTHVDHASSPTVLHAGTSGSNRGSQRRQDRRGPPPQRRRPPQYDNQRPPSSPVGQRPGYGWVYLPITASQQSPHQLYQQSQPRNGSGLLGPAPTTHHTPIQTHLTAAQPTVTGQPQTAGLTPPWAWFSGDQPTALPEMFNTMNLGDSSTSGWHMDTGATDHVHAHTGILDSISDKRDSCSVLVGNGSPIPVSTTGHALFPIKNPYRPLHLHNILITPHIIKNLISVRQFTRHNKCSIEFDEFGFTLKDYKTRQPLIRCDSNGPLYPVTSSAPQVFLSSSSSVWHQRLGHPGDHVLKSLISNKFISCNKEETSAICHSCELGKHTRLPFVSSDSVICNAFDIVHSDVWTSPIASNSGLRYYVIFLDHFTHYLWVFPLKQKSDVYGKFVQFFNYVKTQFNITIKSLQCDNGGEYDNNAFHTFFATHGITFRFSCPHTSQQNGRSERMLRTINNVVRTLLFHSHLPPTYWVEALHMASHLLNLLPSKAIDDETPHFRLYHKHPSYSHLRTFGCLCYPHLTTLHKLAPRTTPCVFLGYPTHHRGFRCLDLSSRKIIISRHVVFHESIFPFDSVSPSDPPSYNFLDDTTEPSPILSHFLHHPTPTTTTPSTSLNHPTPPPPTDHTSPSSSSPPNSADSHVPTPHPPEPSGHPTHHMTTRAKSGITKPIQRLNLHTTTTSPVPRSHIQALRDPNWLQAMNEEHRALISNGTWVLVPRPPGVNVVRSMWLFRHKFHADGTLARYKARLVANGKSQQQGIDCDETFSPVVKPATIRTVLSLAISKQWPIHQLDVKNAFLHGHLQETVYMHQPPGFRDSQHPDYVCHLQRSLYGLKQAPRAWYQRFAQYAIRLGFQQSRTDPSLFIYHTASDTSYLLLYVDDIILTASTTDLLRQIITRLSQEFAMTDLGALNYFLGISAIRSPAGLFLSQQQYATELLERANMTTCNPCRTPAEPVHKLDASGPPVSDPTLYRSLAGALQYLTFTRPDIAFAVQQICLYMHDPREPHFHALKRILRYIRGTLDHGLQLHVSSSSALTAYSDADWGGCPTSRRSTSGYCVFLGDNLISWSSKRQGVVSRSSAEAEYRGVANAVAETSWIRNLLRELHSPIHTATIVYCDNVSATYMSSNPVQHQRTKHIEIDIHFVRDKVAMGQVRVLHVPSRYQYADIFTKGLSTSLFHDFRSSLSVRQSPPDKTAGGC